MPESWEEEAELGLRQFSLSEQSLRRLQLLGMSTIIEPLRSAYDLAYEVNLPLSQCVRFDFLNHELIGKLHKRDANLGNRQFWVEVSQLGLPQNPIITNQNPPHCS